MAKNTGKEHPADRFNRIRHHIFSVFEKTNDFNKALGTLHDYRLSKPWLCGLKAELLVYYKYRHPLKLEPLLDAGVKADFTGMRGKRMINFDVTTNLDYKDIDKYAELVQKRRRQYEIALVNLRNEEVEFMPLRFPICPDCGKFSHYIVFMSRPSSSVFWFASTGQVLVRYCPFCDDYNDIDHYDYEVGSILLHLEERVSDQKHPETAYPDFEPDKYLKKESIRVIQFFETQTQKMLSALYEGDYIMTDPKEGDGYQGSRLLWAHPLSRRYVDDTSDFSYYDGETTL